MDEIDFAISLILMMNSRTSYQEIANKFNMSVNSIHKRIKTMVNLGIIAKFATYLNLAAFRPIPSNLVMFGSSKAKNVEGLIDKLGVNKNIYNVSQQSGNFFIIHAIIPEVSELEPLVSFIKQTAEIPDLKVGLESASTQPDIDYDVQSEPNLSKTDFLIVDSLKDNSRKSIVEIAEEIGKSTKTVRRHLNWLNDKYLVQFTIQWYPHQCITAMIILTLKPSIEVDKKKIIENLQDKLGNKIFFTWTFSTLPNDIILFVWVNTMKELQDIQTSLYSENFESISIHIGIDGNTFPTWRDKYLEEKIKEIRGKTV